MHQDYPQNNSVLTYPKSLINNHSLSGSSSCQLCDNFNLENK